MLVEIAVALASSLVTGGIGAATMLMPYLERFND